MQEQLVIWLIKFATDHTEKWLKAQFFAENQPTTTGATVVNAVENDSKLAADSI